MSDSELVQLIKFLPQESRIAVDKWLFSIRGRRESGLSWQQNDRQKYKIILSKDIRY